MPDVLSIHVATVTTKEEPVDKAITKVELNADPLCRKIRDKLTTIRDYQVEKDELLDKKGPRGQMTLIID
jgi:predicted secreted Zn-dependent protease